MGKADPEIVIEMKPNPKGIFEASDIKKVKKSAPQDARPDASENRPPKRSAAKGRARGRREPIKSTVPRNPVNDFREGVEAGLELISGIRSILRAVR